MTGPYEGGEIVAILPVSDLDRAEAWYGRLGFRAIRTFPDYRILASDELQLHLAESDHAPGTSPTAVYLYVSDAAAVHDAWHAAGVQVRQPLRVADHGLLEFAASDPDGNLWRIGAPERPLDATTEPSSGDPADAMAEGPSDAATDADRQTYGFAKIHKILHARMFFPDKDAARRWFLQLTAVTKDWNLVLMKSPEFKQLEERLDGMLAEVLENA